MNTSRRATLTLWSLLASTALATQGLGAQVGPEAEDPGVWAPPSFGLRVGLDNKRRRNVVGAQVRLPIVPGGEIELMPSVDVTFLVGLREYQYNVEGVYVWDGRAGGLYGGGGLGFRNSVFADGAGRKTELGYTAVVGFRLVGLGLIVPQLEYRWVFVDAAPITYQQLTIGVNLALWRPVRRP